SQAWQAEIRFERHRILPCAMNVRQHGIKRITGDEILNNFGGSSSARPKLLLIGASWNSALRNRFNESTRGQRQQFIRAVAHDEVVRVAAVQLRQFFAQRL